MDSSKFQNKYRIPSARLSWHDYRAGEYFVTICTREMIPYFGKVENGEMILSEIGKLANQNLKDISNHYPYCEIPLHVVMPNHIHLVAFIDDVETVRAPSLRMDRWKNEKVDKKMQQISRQKGLLSVAVGGFKSAITRYANQNEIPFAWQTRFHERVIRNQDELNRIAEYIENNVALWQADCYYNCN